MDRLRSGEFRKLETEVAEKRVKWFERDRPRAGEAAPSPRRAYELFLLEYLGLSEDQVPVVSENDNEIVWASANPCPTLQACRRLGLDTREVCRAVYEKPVQALISQLDPQLRFYRSYDVIRPHAGHCQERIVRADFARLMGMAIAEAQQSRSGGDKGYGAVVLLPSQIAVAAHDTAATENDPSLHAEVNAIREAVRTAGDADLCGGILFATCEPCPMCASLAVWANLTTIVYGASISETAALGKARILVGAEEIVDRSPAFVEIIGGVRREECVSLYAPP